MAARCSERSGWTRLPRITRPSLAVLLIGGALVVPAAGQTAGGDAAPEAAAPDADAGRAAEDYAARRLELEKEMERLRTEMERFEDRERSLLARAERLRLEAQLREQEVAAAELERRRLERVVDRLRFQIERISERISRRRATLGARLRALYQRGPLAPARALASQASRSEWLRAVGFLELLARRDGAEIEALRADSGELERTLAEQNRALREREQERLRAEQSRSALAQALRDHQALLEAVRGDRDTHRAAYDEMVTAARELDALIERVKGGGMVAGEEASWASLGPFRGLLGWPVEGSVRVPFGDVRHPRFGTLTPHRGLTFAARPGSPVQAVFEGEVVFQDWLQGYGHTVILDHHHGYLSVYAHLAEPAVRLGQRVARGGTLGRVGDSGSLEGPQLYFELRRDGLPLDPEPWLAAGLQRAERTGGHP